MKSYTKNRTTILITHKNALLSITQRLILLDQGKIVLDDTYDKVVAKLQNNIKAKL